MTIQSKAIITISSDPDREPREVVKHVAEKIDTALFEFLDDAEYYEFSEDAPGWGDADWVFPASVFTKAFNITRYSDGFVKARKTGLIQVNLSEKLDGDTEDCIELVAFERSGIVKFAQRYVFE